MAVRQLRFRDDPVLRRRCREVKAVDDRTRLLLEDMMDTLHSSETGAALAANQVGLLRRLVVIDYQGYYLKLVNPVIIGQSGVQECVEACLSFPGIYGKTVHPQKVTVQAWDEHGEEILVTCEDEMAKCLCHELDHLDGVVFLDKVTEFMDL